MATPGYAFCVANSRTHAAARALRLNAGFHQLLQEMDGWPADKVIVGIMDADGRLDPEAPVRVAEYFADADVGAGPGRRADRQPRG